MEWIYKGQLLDESTLDKYVGFVYIITNNIKVFNFILFLFYFYFIFIRMMLMVEYMDYF